MRVTTDGAGLYVCYNHAGQTLIRGNFVHDTRCNPFRRGESELAIEPVWAKSFQKKLEVIALTVSFKPPPGGGMTGRPLSRNAVSIACDF